ncbi:hypothetical protein EVB87_179 [Rhizobium phage RHph_N28_1]|nr:hypothetical protein EVB87_179 [Rhizobium phage RHph_N28_1]QIG74208.1 hypothetical protein EVC07_180 [Rhizobium phage RHph_N42]QIG74815.1 hypothetical protein EVC12_180 [Rhizobium phage RHph_I42]QXV73867.1 hypothetical protein [Rhizobium phage RHph_N46]
MTYTCIHEGKVVQPNGAELVSTIDVGKHHIYGKNERDLDTGGPRIDINVVACALDDGRKYIKCDDGKMFYRSLVYSDWSPYGWRELEEPWPTGEHVIEWGKV